MKPTDWENGRMLAWNAGFAAGVTMGTRHGNHWEHSAQGAADRAVEIFERKFNEYWQCVFCKGTMHSMVEPTSMGSCSNCHHANMMDNHRAREEKNDKSNV